MAYISFSKTHGTPPPLKIEPQSYSSVLNRPTNIMVSKTFVVGGNNTFTFAVQPNLPSGLSINPQSGTIEGTPTLGSPPIVYTITQVTLAVSALTTQTGGGGGGAAAAAAAAEAAATSNGSCPFVVVQLTLSVAVCDNDQTCNGGVCKFGNGDRFSETTAFTCRCPDRLIGRLCELPNPFLGGQSPLDKVLKALAVFLFVIAFWPVYFLAYLRARRFFQLGKANTDLTERLMATENEMKSMKKVWQIGEQELTFEREIARGAFGVVHRAVWNDIVVAVKMLARQAESVQVEETEEFDREVRFMQAVRHSNIVLFFGAGVTDNGLPFLVTEFMERGSLNVVLANSPDIAWAQKLQFAHDTALGMRHLHSLGSIHRDLKSGNLLVTKSFRIKVADFGTARLAGMTNAAHSAPLQADHTASPLMTGMVGTPLWMAPEIVFKQPYTQKADVYSYAIVLFEILTQTTPWNELPDDFISLQILDALKRGRRPRVTGYSEDLYTPFRGLMERCWAEKADDRPTFEEVVRDGVFTNMAPP
jgi:hypothetical protein